MKNDFFYIEEKVGARLEGRNWGIYILNTVYKKLGRFLVLNLSEYEREDYLELIHTYVLLKKQKKFKLF